MVLQEKQYFMYCMISDLSFSAGENRLSLKYDFPIDAHKPYHKMYHTLCFIVLPYARGLKEKSCFKFNKFKENLNFGGTRLHEAPLEVPRPYFGATLVLHQMFTVPTGDVSWCHRCCSPLIAAVLQSDLGPEPSKTRERRAKTFCSDS